MSKPVSSKARAVAPFVVLAGVGGISGVVVRGLRDPPRPRPAPSASVTKLPSARVEPSAAPSSAPPPAPPFLDESPDNLPAQREVLFTNLQNQLGLSDEALQKTREIFARSRWMGQGNPKITKHPMSRAECVAIQQQHPPRPADPRCGAPNMVTIAAKLCIDQYEYPNLACDYPVTWVKSNEAQELCQAQGKRLCDAHEWEGACAGAVRTPEQDYAFGQRRLMQEYLHNKEREVTWAYGKTKNHVLCATGSRKSPKCYAPTWELCGTNTYPAGAFPECVSPLGVYDQHGNAAEHMNLPLVAEELGNRGGTGENEMKGSWFIFQQFEAHEDDCRWRAPAWHEGKLMADDAHRNYHLGFRCCKDL